MKKVKRMAGWAGGSSAPGFRCTSRWAIITPPPILQTAPVGAISKRGWRHSVHDPYLLIVDLDALDEGTDDLASRRPTRLVQALAHALREPLQLTDHQPQPIGL